MTDADLGQRIVHLEAIDEIRRLKYTYMGFCDIGYLPENRGPQFTEDAVWDGGEFGRYVGRAAIEEFFASISADIKNGVWLFQSVNFYVNFNVDYADSWAEVATTRPR